AAKHARAFASLEVAGGARLCGDETCLCAGQSQRLRAQGHCAAPVLQRLPVGHRALRLARATYNRLRSSGRARRLLHPAHRVCRMVARDQRPRRDHHLAQSQLLVRVREDKTECRVLNERQFLIHHSALCTHHFFSMQQHTYQIMYEVEGAHWWFAGRRRILESFLAQIVPTLPVRNEERPRILDVGCGTGANLEMLARFGDAEGVDVSDEALAFCRARGLTRVQAGAAEALPYKD